MGPDPHSDFVVWSGERWVLGTYSTPNSLTSLGLHRLAPTVILISRFGSVRVNFIAFVIRFMRTWRTREGSSSVHWIAREERDSCSMRSGFTSARRTSASNIFMAERTSWMGSEGSGETRRRLESRRESVRMSSMMRFWCMAQYIMVSAASMASSRRWMGGKLVFELGSIPSCDKAPEVRKLVL